MIITDSKLWKKSSDSALETPDYRDILLADKKLESDEGELEDISDAAYQKRHLKLENRERNIVNADKKIQLDSLNKLKRDNEEHNDAEAAQQFLRLYRFFEKKNPKEFSIQKYFTHEK